MSIPIDFIESRYKENRVYQNMTAKLNVVSSTLFNSMGCVLVPALCNEVNRVNKEINRYDRRKKSNIGLSKCLIRPPLAVAARNQEQLSPKSAPKIGPH